MRVLGTTSARVAAVVIGGVCFSVLLATTPAFADGASGGGYQVPSASSNCNPSMGSCGVLSNAPGGMSAAPSGQETSGAGGPTALPSDCPVPYTYEPTTVSGGGPLTLNPGDDRSYTDFPAVTQPEQFVLVLCQGVILRLILVPLGASPAAAAAPKVSGADVARQAFASFKLAAPVPKMAPPGELVVQFPTWLWVQGWQAQSATASVPGLSATVTAAPTKIVWTMGDGGSVTCLGPGTPYDAAVPADQQSTDCSYTYHESSAQQPGQAYRGSVTISYGASWTATDGTGGNLGALTATAPFAARVAEIQAINTSP
jgi:hypothetical protein